MRPLVENAGANAEEQQNGGEVADHQKGGTVTKQNLAPKKKVAFGAEVQQNGEAAKNALN